MNSRYSLVIVVIILVSFALTSLSLPISDRHRDEVNNSTAKHDDSEENVHEFIKTARERIKIRDFLHKFDVHVGQVKDKSSGVSSESRDGKGERKKRQLKYASSTEVGKYNNSDSTKTNVQNILSTPALSQTPSNAQHENSKFKDVINSKVGDKGALEVRSCVRKYTSNLVGRKADFNYEYDGIDDTDYNEREPMLSNTTIPGIGNVQVEHCAGHGYCYALWSQADDGPVTILGQGCWDSSDLRQTCSQNECRSERAQYKSNLYANFCCCKSDLCNAAPVLSHIAAGTTDGDNVGVLSTESSYKTSSYGVSVSIAGACLGGVVLTIVLRLLCKHIRRGMHKDLNSSGGEGFNTLEVGGPGFSCSTMCVDNLKLHDNIGEGKHGKVWRGSLGGEAVAVKAMPACKAAIWSRERDIYCLPHMTHPNLLTYFGCDTRLTLDGSTEHLLVLQLAPLGSLRQYLTAHTLEWDSFTKMALGIASALAHLHTQIDKNDQYKPCVVHRDVNSSNILVRADLSCCLSDMSLAMALPDSRKKFQQPKIQEVGTLRYLAPEALEGALDLRRCDAALRAVDIYALALVLWELLSRCSQAHKSPGPYPYALPYHAEVGDHPSLEQMQVVVTRRKARPLFSPRLLNNRAARLARDTCEDCWDHDAEARLTALCVVERLTELRNSKPVPSPTINSNDLRPPNDISNSHSPGSTEDKNSNLLSSHNGNMATIFDFESMQNQPIQPHQGRNPCLERNLALAGPGDRLIDKSLKDMASNSTSSSVHGYGSNDFILMENSVSEINARNEEPQDFSRVDEHAASASRNANRPQNQNASSNTATTGQADLSSFDLSPGEYRQLIRPVTPIGYVQNDVSGENSNAANNGSKKDNIKETNLKMDHCNRWSKRNIKKLLDSKIFKRKRHTHGTIPLETEVNLVLANGKPINNDSRTINGHVRTSVVLNDTRSRNKNATRHADMVGRPSSLPGLNTMSPSSSVENSSGSDNAWRHISNINENNTCTLSPPNQTISMNMLRQNCNENLINGYKELPTGVNGAHQPNQVFAVIVPRTNINTNVSNKDIDSSEWKNKQLINPNKLQKNHALFNESKAPNQANIFNKRHSCDEKVLMPACAKFSNAETRKDGYLIANCKYQPNRNSYSGEYSGVNENSENFDPNMMDYSSNSEDEHMLLLAENGGSKITMRPRFDLKNNDSKSKKKAKHNSNLSIPDSNSLSKITAGSFTSICNKYAPKGKYENFENENCEQLLDSQSSSNVPSIEDLRKKSTIINRNDVSIINLVRNGSILSLCKSDINDTSFSNGNMNGDEDILQGSHCGRMKDARDDDNDSSSDDSTLRDSVSLQEKATRPLSIKQNLSRQHSLELVTELFASSGDVSRFKDPASRIKTPGDVPASVRRVRGHKRAMSMKTKVKPNPLNRLSLYDDRMMFGNSL